MIADFCQLYGTSYLFVKKTPTGQLDPALGTQMVAFIPKYFGVFQEEIKEIMDKLEMMAQEHREEPS